MFIKSFPLLTSTNVSLTTLLIQGLYQMLLSGCLWLSWDINWARRTLWCHTIPAHNYEQYRKGAKTGPSFWDSNCYVFSQGWRWGTHPHSRDWLKNHRTESRVPAAHGRLWPHVIHLTEVQGRTATTQGKERRRRFSAKSRLGWREWSHLTDTHLHAKIWSYQIRILMNSFTRQYELRLKGRKHMLPTVKELRWATVHGVAKTRTWLGHWTTTTRGKGQFSQIQSGKTD